MAFPLSTHIRRPKIRPHVNNVSYNPPTLARKYDFPNGVTGKGAVIAVIELDGVYHADDHAAYQQSLGLPPPNVTIVYVDGATQNSSAADGEVMLDVEIISSIAPGAAIRIYFAPNTSTGYLHAYQQARRDGCKIITTSWGSDERSYAPSDLGAYNAEFAAGAAEGINYFAAAGDNGSSDSDTGNNVDFPASSPWVIGVGGTSTPASGPETVWNDGTQGGATGGGFSTTFTRQAWQPANGQNATGNPNARMVPDVAFNADPNTGFNVLLGGQVQVIGGTSAGSPGWAALTALLQEATGAPVPFLGPILYANQSAFVDITSGNNGAYQAAAGPDPCTGIGRPDGAKVLAALPTGTTPPPVIPPPVVPPPVTPPPTAPAFTLRVPVTIQPGGRFTTRTKVLIPAGLYAAYPVPTSSQQATDEAVAE